MRVGSSSQVRLVDRGEAEKFLDSVSLSLRRRATVYQQSGAVRNIRCLQPGTEYTAEVMGTDQYRTRTFYKDGFWSSDCTCPFGTDCKHGVALMLELLERDKTGLIPDDPSSNRAASLEQLVANALQRKLNSTETRFLGKVHSLYERVRWYKHLAAWELREFLPHLRTATWDNLDLWDDFPKSEWDFYRYILWAISDLGGSIPPSLAAVSDLASIEQAIHRHRRSKRIDYWTRELTQRTAQQATAASGTDIIHDFRVVLDKTKLVVECRLGSDSTFQPLKLNRLKQLVQQHRDGRLEVTDEARLIWEPLCLLRDLGLTVDHHYRLPEVARVVNSILRIPSLQSRIVTTNGKPFTRHDRPLHWAVSHAASDLDDYRVRLVTADNEPLPPLLLVLPGMPSLYVTQDTIYHGPPPWDLNADPSNDLVIPAPALETRAGAEFLASLGVPMPPRLLERTKPDLMQVTLTCNLGGLSAFSPTEMLYLRINAKGKESGASVSFTPSGWQDQPSPPAKRDKLSDRIYVADRSQMDLIPQAVTALGASWDSYDQCWRLRITKKFADKFASWLESLPPGVETELLGELATITNAPVTASVNLDCTSTGMDWFDLKVVLHVTDTELTKEELSLLLNARGGYVRLGEKGWRRLQYNLSDEDDQRLAKLGLSARDFSAEPQRLHALQLADAAAGRFLPEEQVAAIRLRADEIQTRVTPDIPTAVRAELRPYQREGYHFLAYLATNRFGGILADDMGLGKTLQTLAWLAWLREQETNAARKTLVVCPKSVTDNWHAEAARFVPDLRVHIFRPNNGLSVADAMDQAEVLVINYAQLRTLENEITRVNWLAAILDEGQYIKNPESQTARTARALQAEYRLVLTGTPIENRLLDLWSLMAFAMPGVLGNRTRFAKDFDNEADPLARRRLSARVRPFLLRRTKTQVARELPDRIEEDLLCDMEGVQETLYRAELKRAQQMLLKVKTSADLDRERFNFLASLLRLRQICCHPALVDAKKLTADSAKVNALLETLEPLMDEGNKVLVFSQFVSMLDIIQPAIAEKGWNQFILTGSTENRGDLVKQFQETDGAAVFLISLKAGGFGLNLTAASYVVLFDPWWNPAVENQAIDRTHRIGQVNKVIAYRLLIKNSIEEKIRTLQKTKSALADDVLGEETFASSLRIDDLRYLFAEG